MRYFNNSFYKNLSFVAVILFCCQILSAQVDTAFWFAMPKLTPGHAGHPVKICVSTFGDPATITITKPALNNAQVATFNVPANSSNTYEIIYGGQNTAGVIQNNNVDAFACPHGQVSNNGLYIRSSSKVNAYISVMCNNSEIYALKGENGLGKKFYVPMQYQYANGDYSACYNSVQIIGTEDNTTVTIKPSKTLLGGQPANQSFTVTLNKGQVYSFASAGTTGAQHLDGTEITSNKPIVVDVTDDSVTPGVGAGQDLIADQIVPEELAGTQYIVVPSPSAANNYYPATSTTNLCEYAFIFPLEDGTDINIYKGNTVSPSTSYTNLNRGAKKSYHFTDNTPIYINASKPVFVFQMTGAGRELGGTLLPHVYCTGSNAVSYRPLASYHNHTKKIYWVLVCKPEYTSGFQINGSSTMISNSDWNNLFGGLYKYCRKEITSLNTAQSVRITNSLGKFHLGVIDWNESTSGSSTTYDDCSISYFSNYNTSSELSWNTSFTHSDYCEGDSINFVFDTVDITNIRIYGPNDFAIENGDPTYLLNADPSFSGDYVILGEDARQCYDGDFSDTINIQIHSKLTNEIADSVCAGEPYTLNGFNIIEDSTQVPGLYNDSLTLHGAGFEYGCDSIVYLKLKILDNKASEFDTVACQQFVWNDVTYAATGDYKQELQSQSGCDSVVTMHLTIDVPSVYISSSNPDFCQDEETTLSAETDYEQYSWSTGDTEQFINVTKPGTYSVTVTDETGDCQASARYEIPACSFNIFLPNTISPDSRVYQNRYLSLPEEIHRYIKDFEISIYNRWGTLVFHSDDKAFIWHGESSMVTQVYVYIIKYTNLDGKQYVKRGEITVL